MPELPRPPRFGGNDNAQGPQSLEDWRAFYRFLISLWKRANDSTTGPQVESMIPASPATSPLAAISAGLAMGGDMRSRRRDIGSQIQASIGGYGDGRGSANLAGFLLSIQSSPERPPVPVGAFDAPISPLAYGAVGNGVTDDTTAVLAALAALGYLYFPPNYTFLTGQIAITAVNTMIFGGGTIKAKAALNDSLLFFDGTANAGGSFFRVLGIVVDGNKAAQSSGFGAGILLRNAAYTDVSQCYIHDAFGDGIRVENFNNSSVADEVNIVDNRIFSNGRDGIFLTPAGGSFGRVGDHLITGNHTNYNARAGIFGLWLTSSLISQNNVLTNTDSGIRLLAADRCLIYGNASRNNGQNGIYTDLDGTFGRSTDIQIIGNSCHFNHADECDVWSTDRAQIIGNYFGDTDFAATAAYGVQLFQSTSVVMTGNSFVNLRLGSVLNNGIAYVSQGNIGLYNGPYRVTQSQIAGLALTSYEKGFVIEVTDFAHLLLWDGAVWSWAPGDDHMAGCGPIPREYDPLPLAGWHLYDGATVNFLKADGTVGTVTLANLSGAGFTAAYLKFTDTVTNGNAAVAPTFAAGGLTFTGTAGAVTGTFTGTAGAVTGTFTGTAGAVTGTASAPTFTGAALATHQHAVPIGMNSTTFEINSSYGTTSAGHSGADNIAATAGGGLFSDINTSSVSGGTPAGTNSAPTLSMSNFTPAGTLFMNNFTPAGTLFMNNFTPAGTISGTGAVGANGEPANITRKAWFRQ